MISVRIEIERNFVREANPRISRYDKLSQNPADIIANRRLRPLPMRPRKFLIGSHKQGECRTKYVDRQGLLSSDRDRHTGTQGYTPLSTTVVRGQGDKLL